VQILAEDLGVYYSVDKDLTKQDEHWIAPGKLEPKWNGMS
jgi:hypothetical protein